MTTFHELKDSARLRRTISAAATSVLSSVCGKVEAEEGKHVSASVSARPLGISYEPPSLFITTEKVSIFPIATRRGRALK